MSSDGDGEIVHRLCTALASPAAEVSPTDFHNSVHNAATGYWSIGAHSSAPSTALCAYDGSFAAGLLEYRLDQGVNIVNAALLARERGIEIV